MESMKQAKKPTKIEFLSQKEIDKRNRVNRELILRNLQDSRRAAEEVGKVQYMYR